MRVLESTCRLVPSTSSFGKDGKHADTLRSLASKRSTLESERSVRQKEVEVLDEAARGVVNGRLGDLDAFMDSFVQRRRAAQNAVLELTDQIKIIEQDALVLQNSSKGGTNAIATLTLYVERESSVELQLAYGEYWYHPHYTALYCDSWFLISREWSLVESLLRLPCSDCGRQDIARGITALLRKHLTRHRRGLGQRNPRPQHRKWTELTQPRNPGPRLHQSNHRHRETRSPARRRRLVRHCSCTNIDDCTGSRWSVHANCQRWTNWWYPWNQSDHYATDGWSHEFRTAPARLVHESPLVVRRATSNAGASQY